MKKYVAIIIFSILIVLSLFFIYQKLNPQKLNEKLIAGSGTMDGDLILLNSKYPARVDKIFVKEGDSVLLNQKIARLKSNEFLSKREAMEASINNMKLQENAFSKTIEAQKLDFALLSKTLPNAVTIKEESLSALNNSLKGVEIEINELRLNVNHAKKEYARNQKLYKNKAISLEAFELVELRYKTLSQRLQRAKIDKERLGDNLQIASIELQMAKDNLSKIESAKQNLFSAQDKLQAMVAQTEVLKSQKNEINAMINELSLYSPTDGFVIEKVANEGEVVSAGGVVVTLSDTASYYLKLYVDTLENGRIKLGDDAVIFVDAYPNKPIKAKVVNISAKAEFTPKEVSVRSDRIQRVYSIHLKPLKYDPILKLGTPAIGIVSIDAETLPSSLTQIPQI